ncbi:unnamed protein product [Brachionus calyciflorus]|uniref:Uncharacterized protein n=1 Tax=Brachionus calyciflorus TaxID=104777 RepID=A0A814CJT2_9BILA|nr:unnamed protein product [Brachionus calyciflorus]
MQWNGTNIKNTQVVNNTVNSIDFLAKLNLTVIGTETNIILWNLTDNNTFNCLQNNSRYVLALNDTHLLTGYTGFISILTLENFYEIVNIPDSNLLDIRTIKFINQNKVLVSSNKNIILFSILNLETTISYAAETEIISIELIDENFIIFQYSSKEIDEKNLRIWNFIEDSITPINMHEHQIYSIIELLSFDTFLTGDDNGCIQLWNTTILKYKSEIKFDFQSIDHIKSLDKLDSNINISTLNETEMFISLYEIDLDIMLEYLGTNLDLNDCLSNCSGHGKCVLFDEAKFECKCWTLSRCG